MSAIQTQSSLEANRMQKLARLKKFDDLESSLTLAIESGLLATVDLLSVLDVVAEQNDPKRTESLFWFVLTLWTERKGPEAGLDIARHLAALFPQSESIRNESAELYRKAHADKIPQIETLLEMTLLRKNTPLTLALQQMDKLIGLLAQPYVLDTILKIPGKIVGLDTEKKELTITIAGQEKPYDAVAVLKLESLPADDFRALAVFENETLQLLARENPEQFVLDALKTFGPTLTFRDLKSHLTQVILTSAWPKWWTAAKTKILKSPFIELSGGHQPTLTLRTKPLAYEDRIRAEFQDAKSFEEKILVIFDYLHAHHPESAPDEKLLQAFIKTLIARGQDPDQAAKLASQAVLSEIHKIAPQSIPASIVKFKLPADPSTLLGTIYNDDVARVVLNFIRESNPNNWYDLFAAVLPGASAAVCDWIASELTQQGIQESFTRAIEAILHWPDKYVRAIVWLYKSACTGNPPEYLTKIDRSTILTGLLTAAQILKRKPPISDTEQQKRALTQIKNAITADNSALVRTVLKSSSHDYARYLKDTVPRNTGLGDAMSSDFVNIIRETHPGLFSKNVPPWEEDAIYTTEPALERKNQEFNKLTNVDILHNARTIGEAAERGDLSENAEFTAALEERDRLTERATRMRADIKKAKILHHSITQSDFVTIGTAVKARNLATNEIDSFLFLGPWDADPQRSIYSYLSPIAQSFMGKKVGETVIHNSNAGQSQWKIEELK
ncbi:MAG: GreA/GreB family elongation factor [Phycisphaerae bacterium]